jgi:hypothetical protein
MSPRAKLAAGYWIPEYEYQFPDRVLLDQRYRALLDDLGIGKRWQLHMIEGVKELAPISGIEFIEEPMKTVKPTPCADAVDE